MSVRLFAVLAGLLLLLACDDDSPTGNPATDVAWGDNQTVLIETSMGDIVIELFHDEAPITTHNFVRYVRDGFYDGLTFHRVIYGFVIQGGAFDENMDLTSSTYPPIENEAANGLQNLRGTISMARTSQVHSATSQFFINTRDNAFLDHEDDTPQGYGYAVFGRVKSGMDVVDAIESVPTGVRDGFNDVPLTPVIIERMMYRSIFTPD
jgi:cyclophilin family peptidyl-prolyl cis-trans isomerase